MRKTETKGKSFEASLAALEKIVHELERGDLPLEESLVLFENGVKLSRECQDRLSQAERRIEVLMRDADGHPVVGAFDGDESELKSTADTETETDESVF